MESNPYAAPQSVLDHKELADRPAKIRFEHLSTETAIKNVGGLMAFGAFVGLATLLPTRTVPAPAESQEYAALLAAVCVFQLLVGVCMARLQSWTRIPGVLLSAIGLLRFPLGTLFCLLFLYYLMSKKGRFVLSRDYRAIVAATPEVKQHTSAAIYVLLFILLVAAALGLYAFYATKI